MKLIAGNQPILIRQIMESRHKDMIAKYSAQLESVPGFSNGLWPCRFPGDQRGNEPWPNLACINLPVCNH